VSRDLLVIGVLYPLILRLIGHIHWKSALPQATPLQTVSRYGLCAMRLVRCDYVLVCKLAPRLKYEQSPFDLQWPSKNVASNRAEIREAAHVAFSSNRSLAIGSQSEKVPPNSHRQRAHVNSH
jgi:hypothetical protein